MDKSTFDQGLAAFEAMLALQVQLGRDVDQAGAELRAQVNVMFPGFAEAFDEYVEARRNRLQKIAIGNLIRRAGGNVSWYGGPKTHSGVWPSYRDLISTKLPGAAVEAIDDSTNRILSACANPNNPGDRRKGLVIGYVQSGKTANYAALIAKGVDAGYRIIIVLAGMYSNLRAQTQARLANDLAMNKLVGHGRSGQGIAWYQLTDEANDIGATNGVGIFNVSANVAVMIVKKNETRLGSVAKFLNNIPEAQRRARGILIIDDESDQATPNTKGQKQLISTINSRIRDIWKATLTGTYVAYTATPFANVFIDPSDDEDLYPDDFAMVLPRPNGYMGADTFFDLELDADRPEDRTEKYSRTIPDSDIEILATSGNDLSSYAPHMTETLAAAIRWFILATAIRAERTSEIAHSSMLLHTTARVVAHQRMKDVVDEFLVDLKLNRDSQEAAFRVIFDREVAVSQLLEVDGERIPCWGKVWNRVKEMIGRLKVVIDNGQSDDRLVYPDDDPQFVIAIGGGTLSRGLTLEGLVVSYFLRTSNAYDTLLQMGRWFGFRPHYADLARLWVSAGLVEDYAHLARVEADLRAEVGELEREGRTPRDLAIRVRSHPGRLVITGRDRMWAADVAHVGLGGTRHQTTLLDKSAAGAAKAQSAVREFVARLHAAGVRELRADGVDGSVLFPDVTNEQVEIFLEAYANPGQGAWLQEGAVRGWLEAHGDGAHWNVVLVSGARASSARFDFSEKVAVRPVRRAPLKSSNWEPSEETKAGFADGAEIVNIRALMSGGDWLLDVDLLDANNGLTAESRVALADLGGSRDKERSVRTFRGEHFPKTGLLLIYVIDADSEPAPGSNAREPLDAPGDLIGVGVVYPHSAREDDFTYYAVVLPSTRDDYDDDEGDAPAPVDNEGDYEAVVP